MWLALRAAELCKTAILPFCDKNIGNIFARAKRAFGESQGWLS
jgi:hypothetical protein